MSCPDCFTGHIHTGTPKGKMQDLYGYKTYVSLPANNPSPKSTIVFFPDAFGLNLVNNKLMADHYAMETNCKVILPDVFPGGAASLGTMNALNRLTYPVGPWYNYINPIFYVSRAYHLVFTVAGMGHFLITNNMQKVFPECLRYTREARAALPADGKLGVAGFCWGGYMSTKMCCEPIIEGSEKPLVDAQFSAHPSGLDVPKDLVEAVEKFKVPYSCAVAEMDFQFDKAASEKAEAAIKQKGDKVGIYEFVLYKDCHHGFSVRASLEEKESTAAQGYENAAKQAVAWFNKYLH